MGLDCSSSSVAYSVTDLISETSSTNFWDKVILSAIRPSEIPFLSTASIPDSNTPGTTLEISVLKSL